MTFEELLRTKVQNSRIESVYLYQVGSTPQVVTIRGEQSWDYTEVVTEHIDLTEEAKNYKNQVATKKRELTKLRNEEQALKNAIKLLRGSA